MGSGSSKCPKQPKANKKNNKCGTNLFNGQQVFQIVGVLSNPMPQQNYYPPPPPPPQPQQQPCYQQYNPPRYC